MLRETKCVRNVRKLDKMKRFKRVLGVVSSDAPLAGFMAWLNCLKDSAEGIKILLYTRSAVDEYPMLEEGGDHSNGLEDLRDLVADRLVGHHVEVSAIEGGELRGTLSELATGEFDLLVLPLHDHASRSLAERLARKSPIGILAIPEDCIAPAKRVVAAVDFSDITPLTLDWAHAFSTLAGDEALLSAVHVLDLTLRTRSTMVLSSEEMRSHLRDTTKTMIETSLEDHAPNHDKWSSKVIEGRIPGLELVRFANKEADLLVVGGHGKNVLSVALMGSNSAEVIRAIKKPVLIVKRKNESIEFLRTLIGWSS